MVIQNQQQTRVIKTNDGWMTFLVITLILLVSSFFTINYLRMKADFYMDPISEKVEKAVKTNYNDPLKAFEEKEKKRSATVKDIIDEDDEEKSIQEILAEKRRLGKIETSDQKRPKENNLGLDQMDTRDLEKDTFETRDLMQGSFFVVNHVFTYENVFKSDDPGEATFLAGSNVFLFVEMYNLQEDLNGEIDIAIDFMLLDGNNDVIPGYDMEDLVVYKGKPPYKEGYFLARMTIPLGKSFEPGKYYVDILIRDKVSDVNRKEVWVMRVEEPSL